MLEVNLYDPHAWGTGNMSGAWVALKAALYDYQNGQTVLITELELTAKESKKLIGGNYDSLDIWLSLESLLTMPVSESLKDWQTYLMEAR